MSDVTPAPGQAGPDPLSPAQLGQIEQAFARRRRLGRASSLARLNGITWLVSAVLCVPFAGHDGVLLFVIAALAIVGVVELRAGRMLRALDTRAPKWLALNQLALLAAFGLYFAISIVRGLSGSGISAELDGQQPDIAAGLKELGLDTHAVGDNDGELLEHAIHSAVIFGYLAVFAGCALYQGGCAYYYWRSAPALRAHRTLTPAWVLELERRVLGW